MDASWAGHNEQYLVTGLAWLRQVLKQQAGIETEGEAGALTSAVLAVDEDGEFMPALPLLAQQFGLSAFEQQLLLLCVGLELDTQIASLCAKAQDHPQRTYPTFALALTIFEQPDWSVVMADGALRYWRLIEVNEQPTTPLTVSALRADMRVVNYLKGVNQLDERLAELVNPVQPARETSPLPPSQQATVDEMVNAVTRAERLAGPLPVMQLLGTDSTSAAQLAQATAAQLGLRLYRLPLEQLPTQVSELTRLAWLWHRETLLLPVALLLLGEDMEAKGAQATALRHFLSRCEGICFLTVSDKGVSLGRSAVTVEVAKPTPLEQRQVWEGLLGKGSADVATLLSSQFRLNMTDIIEIASTSLASTPLSQPSTPPSQPSTPLSQPSTPLSQPSTPLSEQTTPPSQQPPTPLDQAQVTPPTHPSARGLSAVEAQLWTACLEKTRPTLDNLAQRIDVKATWEDLVLPAEETMLLYQITEQVRQRSKVYDDWGFRQKMNRGLGISAMFSGESGTGKTMAAEVIANALQLHLYRIDLSAVVSKYIGETEKNLRKLFDAAEDGGAILFFDEADALFGKRSEVKDSHDRYANIEINYLLQRIEAYRGLAILATNLRSTLDAAFLRRLRFIVTFPIPGRPERLRLWQKVFPKQMPVETLDYRRLANLNLTGGNIHTIAVNAAFLAARAQGAVGMSHILMAARGEYRKLDRPINEEDFRL